MVDDARAGETSDTADRAAATHAEPDAPHPAAWPSTATGTCQLSDSEILKFDLYRTAFYHEDRERHFDSTQRWLMFVVVGSGSAAFANIAAQNQFWGTVIALFTTLAGMADLVFDISGRARRHGALRRLAYSLLAEIIRGVDATDISARLTESYGDEPNLNGTVNALAHNAAMLALGRPRRFLIFVPAWRRALRHLVPSETNLSTYAELGIDPPGRGDADA